MMPLWCAMGVFGQCTHMYLGDLLCHRKGVLAFGMMFAENDAFHLLWLYNLLGCCLVGLEGYQGGCWLLGGIHLLYLNHMSSSVVV